MLGHSLASGPNTVPRLIVGYTGNVGDDLAKDHVDAKNLLANVKLGDVGPESLIVDEGAFGDVYTITDDGVKVISTNSLVTFAQEPMPTYGLLN